MRHPTTHTTRSTGPSTGRSIPDLFDADADDLTTEFWGEGAGWAARDGRERSGRAFQIRRDEPSSALRLDDTPASLQAIKDGIAAFRPTRRRRGDTTAPVERTREHGIIRPSSLPPDRATDPPMRSSARRGRPSAADLPHRDATIAELATGTFEPAEPDDAPHGDPEPTFMIPVSGDLTGRLGLAGADPARVRVGIALLALLLAIPLALALRSTNDREVRTEMPPAVTSPEVGAQGDATPTVAAGAGVEPVGAAAMEPSIADATTNDVATADGAENAPAVAPAEPVSLATASESGAGAPTAAGESSASAETITTSDSSLTESAPVADAVNSEADALDQPATVAQAAERAVPDCSMTYTAGAGDSWYRMADEAGVAPAELLAQNTATIDTVIFPGDTICLPPGASVPTPPATIAPTTTAAPTRADEPETTAAPTTTDAPTTTIAPVPASSTAEVQALIREIWPDDVEERAIEIAYRESGWIATADNGWCCVGVFQLYWTVHQGWLDDYGIHTREQLKDARKNITAAYALYQSSGGWGPWSTA